MLIEPGVWMFASGAAGFDLGDPLDCNAYAFASTAGLVLFDAGAGRDIDGIITTGTATGIAWSTACRLFLTHAHADHAGGAAALRTRLSLQVNAGEQTGPLVEAGDETTISLPAARAAGIYPPDYRFSACTIDQLLRDDEVVHVGDLEIRTVATPGHSRDHVSYLVRRNARRWLVAGDAVFAGGRVILQNTPDCSLQDTIASLQRLATLGFDALLPGHGTFSLQRGHRHVEAALERPRRLLPPQQLA